MEAPAIENVTDGLEPIALIVRAEFDDPGIRFFTPANFSQQVAFMRRPRGYRVVPHVHNLLVRQVLYTQEVLFIRRGKVKVDLFSSDRKRIASKILKTGDLILLCGGGHSLEMLEESVIIEVKQGPYAGEDDKTRFEEAEPGP
ncbi:MAG: putative cytosolic protein [Deltaproteobacteria bacterium]|nr:putative cytosolic protein [Deltaproteobacteria bacterium]